MSGWRLLAAWTVFLMAGACDRARPACISAITATVVPSNALGNPERQIVTRSTMARVGSHAGMVEEEKDVLVSLTETPQHVGRPLDWQPSLGRALRAIQQGV